MSLRAGHGHGMAWQGNGMGTAWAWHAMCELALRQAVYEELGVHALHQALHQRFKYWMH